MLHTWYYSKYTYRPHFKVGYRLKNYGAGNTPLQGFYRGLSPLASNLNIALSRFELRTLPYWRSLHINYTSLMHSLCLFYFWVKYFTYTRLSARWLLNTTSLEKAAAGVSTLAYTLLE